MTTSGQIVILNGAPRSGKSSIVTAIQESFPGVWINLGVEFSTGASCRPTTGRVSGFARVANDQRTRRQSASFTLRSTTASPHSPGRV